jgi:serpin B
MARSAVFALILAAALAACQALASKEQQMTLPADALVSPSAEPTSFAVSGRQGFGAAIYNVAAREPGNQFISPLSIETAFALTYPGARGQTASEMASAFGFAADPAQAAAQTRAVLEAIQGGDAPVTIANAAWVERTFNLEAPYMSIVRDTLGGQIEALDFRTAFEPARARINAWTAERTNNRIQNLLPIGSVRADTRLVLTNAVFFKADWADQFTAEGTRPGPFHLAGGGTSQAPLMNQRTHARYIEGEGFQGAELDYAGGQFALDVFLPRTPDGLAAFEAQLDGARLESLLTQLGSAPHALLALTLPKVTMESSYELGDAMQAVGVRTAFSGGADFSGISSAEGLMISRVIHRTFLAIDEKGTEAAAATAIVMPTAAMPRPEPEPILFTADRPFLLVLRHKPSGEVLFIGRVVTP